MLVVSMASIVGKNLFAINEFKIYPWLLAGEIIAFALFLASTDYYLVSFLLALATSSLFVILLIMYLGILTSKGFVPPGLAFCLSCGSIRAGIVIGNSLAILYEHNPLQAELLTNPTSLVFVVLLVVLLIFLVRQEFNIAALTADPLRSAELKTICVKIAKEFSLSQRETDVLVMMSLGHTTDSIANKLVLSPYTVNTHIRHIYEKTNIHKRSELLHFVNSRCSHY